MNATHQRAPRARRPGTANARRLIQVGSVILLATVLGCITEPKPKHETPPVPEPPLNSTPDGAIKRFVWACENKKITEFANLLTEDFTFEFSTATDPTLAQQFETGWFKQGVVTAARHLFEGYTDSLGHVHPAASSISLTFARTLPVGDTEGRDTTLFKVLATRLDGFVELPPVAPQTEPTRYIIDNNVARIFLVRGDAARDVSNNPTVLPPLPADSTRWYIYRWLDETQALGGAPGAEPTPARTVTWGAILASCR
jgi:hypothetical protein